MAWQEQDAKAQFSEFLEASLRDGPQIVTRHGVEAAVLVAIEEWRRMKHAARPTLKQLLLGPGARFEIRFLNAAVYNAGVATRLERNVIPARAPTGCGCQFHNCGRRRCRGYLHRAGRRSLPDSLQGLIRRRPRRALEHRCPGSIC